MSGSRLFGSVVFNREDRVRFPGKTEYFFSYASFLCYDFDVVRPATFFFTEIDDEIFSTVILSLQLIQEGQLSVSGERMCKNTG